MARFVVEAVVLEGRSARAVAAAHGVSKSWVAELVRRYRAGGYEALEPRSKAPQGNSRRVSIEVEERIIQLRKQLSNRGLDAGPQTIHYHLGLERDTVPGIATIWRILRRRGFVADEPRKRPKSSWIRFEAKLPNECWQSDYTLWALADGTEAKILNFIDDHSRLIVSSRAYRVLKTKDVLADFLTAAGSWGFPAALLTDNGSIYTATNRKGRTLMQIELSLLGIDYKHSRPYHPQTMGKVERFHQTLKLYLIKQPPAKTIRQLQAQIDAFVAYYNEVRPHRARDRMTPRAAFDARDKARPIAPSGVRHDVRVLHTTVTREGSVIIYRHGKRHGIGIGVDYVRVAVTVLIDDCDIRIITKDGELLRHLTLDPTKLYEPSGKSRGGRRRMNPEPSTMS